MQTGMLIDVYGVLVDASGTSLIDSAVAVLRRMRLAQVPVGVVGHGRLDATALANLLEPTGENVSAARLETSASTATRLPSAALLQLIAQLQMDPVTSWFITAEPANLQAAASAGIGAAVLLGDREPDAGLLLRVERARDLADAPRVMIPAQGGCWHEH